MNLHSGLVHPKLSPSSLMICLRYNTSQNKTGSNTIVKVKLVKCQNEDLKVINEEKYMLNQKCDKLLCK